MDKAMQAALEADFADEQMGHKPVTWCKQCSDITKQNRYPSACDRHRVAWCGKCRTKITDGHNCLTFVGHADVRHRLCSVDPEWTWEPFEFPGTGSLVIVDGHPVGMWINLTVGGVTKPGYGSCDKGKPEAVKELIGDALRNAGQSFGIAWKLWAKGERTGDGDGSGQDGGGERSTAAGDAGRNGDSEDWRKSAPANAPRKGSGNGKVARPTQAEKPAAQAEGTASEPDPDGQVHADEAAEARSLDALRAIHKAAFDAGKLGATIRNPASGNTGPLGPYLEWRRKQLTDDAKAWKELESAAVNMSTGDLEAHVQAVAGVSIEAASAAQLREAAKALMAKASA